MALSLVIYQQVHTISYFSSRELLVLSEPCIVNTTLTLTKLNLIHHGYTAVLRTKGGGIPHRFFTGINNS